MYRLPVMVQTLSNNMLPESSLIGGATWWLWAANLSPISRVTCQLICFKADSALRFFTLLISESFHTKSSLSSNNICANVVFSYDEPEIQMERGKDSYAQPTSINIYIRLFRLSHVAQSNNQHQFFRQIQQKESLFY